MRYQIKYSFSDKLKRARKAANLTQKELAEKTGVSQNSINSYEIGRRKPSSENLRKLSLFFNVDQKKFLEDEDVYPTEEEMILCNTIIFEKIQAELNQFLTQKGKLIETDKESATIVFDYEDFVNRNWLIHFLLGCYNICNAEHFKSGENILMIGETLKTIVQMDDDDIKKMYDFAASLSLQKRLLEISYSDENHY